MASAFMASAAVAADQDISLSIPATLIADLQSDLGLEEFQAAAIAGNLAQETGNFTVLHEQGGSGLGYSQWTGSRRRAFQSFAEGEIHSYRANYGFLRHELQTGYSDVLNALRRTDTTEEATRLFMKRFLRPNPKYAAFDKRLRHAAAFLDGDYSGSGCTTGTADRSRLRIASCPES